MKPFKILLFAFLLLSVRTHYCQNPNLYKTFGDITERDYDVVLNRVEKIYRDSSKSAIKNLNAAINVFRETGKREQAAMLLMLTGKQDVQILNDSGTAVKKFREASDIFTKLNKPQMANRSQRFIADVYVEANMLDKALSIYIEVLNKSDNYPEEKFFVTSQMGTLFKKYDNSLKAFEYFEKAKIAYKALLIKNDDAENKMISNYRQIGVLYRDRKQYDSAEKYFKLSIAGAEKSNIPALLASNYNSLALLYEKTNQDQKALDVYLKSIELKRQLKGRELALATSLANVTTIYLRLKQLDKAEKCIMEAELISRPTNDKKSRLDILFRMRDFLKVKRNSEKLIQCDDEIIEIQEALHKKDVAEQTAEMEAIYQNEKKSKEIAEANLKNNSLQKDLDYKDRERKIFIIGTILLLGLLGVATKMYLEVRKGNRKLNLKNEEVLQQKQIVEHQNKEIIDSINYAQKIQRAILPAEDEFRSIVGDSFVLFKPKDIVSGDFYWCCEKDGYTFYATVDCTGHGVPGGFMSMLATSLLTEVVLEKNILEPREILTALREKIIASLKQKGIAGENKDGMDMTVCRINKNRTELLAGAANNPVWIKRGNEMMILKADKIPVGYSHSVEQKFTQQKVELQKNDTVYSFTDGYADQFGGPKGKKFKYKQLEEFLFSVSSQPLQKQKELLESEFNSWKGNLEQLDDVCVIGVRI
ncbi:MAG: hypothetical protein K0S32_2326 [Bacteroidetes bacterium]|nr:hypothetical protein [Bacteroidota bacterium]